MPGKRATLALSVFVALLASIGSQLIHDAWASRNASGTYSLPAGNPVVTGTAISSTWANNTLADLKTEMTDSLSRSGKGAMLSPLQLYAGTSSAPGMCFASETGAGFYRAGSHDFRAVANAVTTQKWTDTTTTVLLGLTATQSTTNGAGLTGTGNGAGPGVAATGGATGPGINASAGGSNAQGINTTGSGTGAGIAGTGGTTGPGGYFQNGTAATGGTRRNAIELVNGDLSLDGVVAPTATTAVKNRLTPTNFPKAWAYLTGTTPTIAAGFNVASVTCSANCFHVTLAQAMASTSFAIICTEGAGGATVAGCYPGPITSSSAFDLCGYDYAGAAVNLCAGSNNPSFVVYGAQ